jgi:hypothetical protein
VSEFVVIIVGGLACVLVGMLIAKVVLDFFDDLMR